MTEVIEKTEHKKGYKKTKLGWIPEDWDVVKFKDIGQSIIGLTYSPNDIVEKGLLVLRSSNIKDSKVVCDDNVYVSKKVSKKLITKSNDILMCVRNGSKNLVGKSALIKANNEGFTFGAFMSILRSKYNSFLYQFLQSSYAKKQYTGATSATINQITSKDLDLLQIPFPKIQEQEKIVEILSAWDDGIETLEKLIEVKKHYLKNIAKKLLSNKTKSSEWSEFSLGSISINLNKKVCEKKLPVLSITAGTGFVLQSDKFGKNIAGNQYKNYTLLRKNEFSYNKGNSKKYAQGCVYCLKNYEEAAVPNVFISFKLNNEIALNEYFEQLFKYNYHGSKLKKYINSGVRDDGLLNLNSNNFFKIKFKIPQIEEQQKIVDVLNSYDREIELLNLKLEKLKEQKKGLMQKLLTGQIRVKI